MIGNDVVQFARQVDRAAVGQVAAVVQCHAHDGIARLQQRLLDGDVGRRAGERLDVDVDLVGGDVVGSKRFGAAPPGQRFNHVGVLHAPVVAPVTVAAVVGQVVLVVQNLVLGQPAGLRVGVALGVDVHQR